mmetsp:Transcript_22256/g.31091  ORF Transcript_22256/g.31091 Transcript_22256/m.31091 type:complete len:258 (-) Transcript_22256:333-1106(-)|eukprot:CAMPEP_0184493248 /NCGR_PEP_ID=MMETSP0113_2-20130426/25498_1 /TAXON_ID=91329 /ORGANISM="Norrisiella sphaerica, Strain BC52" /LENGTH=257 /DNA_ID=CAMNT_0026878449 /DNA_START=24 /DNA_END=797 /DNA_ORIENTATION=+
MSRGKLFIGNWKCNGSFAGNQSLVKAITDGLAKIDLKDVEVFVAPSMLHLLQVCSLAAGSKLGVCAQNVSANPCGAFTGEVSAYQLKDAKISCAIIGHSERRQSEKMQTFESNKLVAQKVKAAMEAGLKVCVCVGETDGERKEKKTFAVIEEQIKAIASAVSDWNNICIAYEPLWAIGTGNTATSEQAQEVHAYIRKYIAGIVNAKTAEKIIICYGGSVKPKNSAELIAQPDIDGFLVGGASLKADSFVEIVYSMTK